MAHPVDIITLTMSPEFLEGMAEEGDSYKEWFHLTAEVQRSLDLLHEEAGDIGQAGPAAERLVERITPLLSRLVAEGHRTDRLH